jgi:cbb3-type cytochrome oxidase subunit 3
MEYGMILIPGIALIFFAGVLYSIFRDRNREKSQEEEIPIFSQGRRDAAGKGQRKQ